MRRSLAERSGREYPHNAIYEILTYRVKEDDRNEPIIYSPKVVDFYHHILGEVTPEIMVAYVHVYEMGETLEQAGKRLKCSGPTVRKLLNEVFYAQDKNGYLVGQLKNLSR